MSSIVKPCVKRLFRLLGVEIKRIPQFEPYGWLKGKDIHTILDIGANTGQFASQFHRLLPDAMIYSFEPLEDCYNELLKKMEHNPKIHAFNFAVGDKNGEVPIYRNDYTPSSSLLSMEELHKQAFPFTKHTTVQTIPIKRLDDIAGQMDIVENVLVKIDVQGTEDKVIAGGGNLISMASVLIVETCFQPLYSGQPLFEDIYNLLKPNFKYMGSWGKSRISQLDGSPLFEDSIFVNKSS